MTRRRVLAAVLLTPGLLVRLWGATLAGTTDVDIFVRWARTALEVGPVGVYGAASADYSPGSIYLLWLSARVFDVVDPGLSDPRVAHAAANLFPTLFGAATAVLLFWFARRELGRGWASVIAVTYWVTPAVVLASPVLGYQDPSFLFLVLAALVALYYRRHTLALVLAVASFLVKQPGILVLPVVALVVVKELRPAAVLKAAASSLGVAALAFLPFLFQPQALGQAFRGMRSLTEQNLLSGNALNLWWLVTYRLDLERDSLSAVRSLLTEHVAVSDFTARFGFSPRPAGFLMLGAVTVANLAVLSRLVGPRRFAIFWATAIEVYAYQVFAVSVHENHLVYFPPLYVLLIAFGAPHARTYAAVTTIAALNLFLFYGFGRDVALPLDGLRLLPGFDVTLALAAVNVGLFFWVFVRYVSVLERGAGGDVEAPEGATSLGSPREPVPVRGADRRPDDGTAAGSTSRPRVLRV